MLTAPVASRAKMKAHERSRHRQGRIIRRFPRNGFNRCFVLSLVNRLCCHHTPRDAKASSRVNASIGASGSHDFAVRTSITRQLIEVASIASRAQRS